VVPAASASAVASDSLSTIGQALAIEGPLITSKSVECRVVVGRFIVGLLVDGAALQQVGFT
jgi:hypothetical protein